MKSLLACTALFALIACETVPAAAEKECRDRHGLTVGSSEYRDCVSKLSHGEAELRHAN